MRKLTEHPKGAIKTEDELKQYPDGTEIYTVRTDFNNKNPSLEKMLLTDKGSTIVTALRGGDSFYLRSFNIDAPKSKYESLFPKPFDWDDFAFKDYWDAYAYLVSFDDKTK